MNSEIRKNINQKKKRERYQRIHSQLEELFAKTTEPVARMATLAAILFHKMPHYFWCGFYILRTGELIVGPYQGPLACLLLPRDQGVCWAGIRQGRTIIVEDVHAFPDHIACDDRSLSEIVVPVRNEKGEVVAVLDVDGNQPAQFDQVDAQELERIVPLIYSVSST